MRGRRAVRFRGTGEEVPDRVVGSDPHLGLLVDVPLADPSEKVRQHNPDHDASNARRSSSRARALSITASVDGTA